MIKKVSTGFSEVAASIALFFAAIGITGFVIFGIYALRTAFFFGVFALVISIGQWQVDHAPVLAAAVLCAFLFPSGSSSSKG